MEAVMKQQNKFLLVALVLALSTLACGITFDGWDVGGVEGSNVVETEERQVSGFNRVDMAGIGFLVIEFGDTEALTIEAESNIMDYIQTNVVGQELIIKLKEGRSYQPTEPIKYYLTVIELDELEVSGLGSVELPEIEATDFFIEISGGGTIDIDRLDAKLFELEVEGLGNLTVDEGTVVRQDISISGGGNYQARRVESQDADVDISGLGNATLRVSDTLSVNISGGGSVEYYGNPVVTTNISGLGKVDRLGD
jgi:hypothetical protein